MKKILFFSTLLILICNTILCFSDEILEKIDAMRAPGSSFSCDLKIITKKGERKRIAKFILFVKYDKSLVKFTYPPVDKGKIVLMDGDDIWIYIPDTKRPIRLSPQLRLLGMASSADVARVVYSIDYTTSSITKETIDGKKKYKIELRPKSPRKAYGKIILYVEEEDFKLRKADFYTVSGKLLKTVYYKNYNQILGKEITTELEICDPLFKDEQTIMKYDNFKIIDIPDEYFQKSYLEHLK